MTSVVKLIIEIPRPVDAAGQPTDLDSWHADVAEAMLEGGRRFARGVGLYFEPNLIVETEKGRLNQTKSIHARHLKGLRWKL